jgi:GTP-binding protein Era
MSHRFGYVALIGQPNVGKSTLLNAMVGQKVSIVSDKAQTTRRNVVGIMQGEGFQIAFIDTPGVHEPHTVLGKTMLEAARTGLSGVDLTVVVVDISRRPNEADKRIAKMVGDAPTILAMNKMDRLRAEMVVPHTEAYCQLFGTEDYMMTTATQGLNLDKLVEMIVERLEEGEPEFDSETYTDQTVRFMAAELIREKVLVATRQEVPHACAVHIREWEEEEGRVTIYADILVEKDGQKAILIGNKGQFIKTIGTQARLEIAELIGKPVHLDLHIKVRPDWRQSPRTIRELQEETG